MRKVHFMGIGGSGISGVADLAKKMGYQVSGCDLETGGHEVNHLKNIDLLVVTPAVFYQSAKHPELVEGKKRKIVITWQEFLGKYLHKGKKVVCIAGTHGKSTTAAMAGKLLVDAGFDPSVVIGAKYPDWQGNSHFGKGNYFITEADEFFDNFLNYHPEIIILNNIEFDHPDYFKNGKAVFDAYKKFINNLVGEKILIMNTRSLGINKILGKLDLKKINLVKVSPDVKLNLKIPGKYNISNAQMVYSLGVYLGIKESLIKKSLETFTGLQRRLELISNKNDIRIYDDYAHHPTAIAATLKGLREKYPKNRIWAIVEPHGFVRTYVLLAKYKSVFKNADKVIIGPIFKARDAKTLGMNPQKIAKISGHSEAKGINSFDQIVKIIKKEIKSGDIILVMGAGKSNLWAKAIAKLI